MGGNGIRLTEEARKILMLQEIITEDCPRDKIMERYKLIGRHGKDEIDILLDYDKEKIKLEISEI